MRVALVSFRLGGPDGVSVETEKWRAALHALGHTTYRVAGAFGSGEPGDVTVPGLGYSAAVAGPDDSAPPAIGVLDAALADADLVVVENVFGLPLHPAATAVLAQVLASRPAIGHHHDLPSQRREWAAMAPEALALFPPDLPRMMHVTINELSRRELAARGLDATVVPNTFDPDPAPGRLAAELRARLGLADGERADATLALVPSRVIPRKDIGRAIAFCEALQAAARPVVLLVTGPVEDGYASVFARMCAATDVRVAHHPDWFGHGGAFSMADAYAAADVVVFASAWEGFGNPVLESVAHARPLVVSPYPVLAEIEAMGFRFTHLGADPSAAVAAFLDGTSTALVARNREILATTLSPARLRRDLAALIDAIGPFPIGWARQASR